MTLFSEFLIIAYQPEEYKETEIIEYFHINGSSLPDYLRNVGIMCFTSVFDVKLEQEQQKKQDDINSKNYLHQFVITDQSGQLRYCTSLVVFESLKSDFYTPFAYVIVSEQSNLIRQKSYMRALYNSIFDRVTRYRDRGWQMGSQKLSNQQLFEFYLSVGITNLDGLYFVPKQIMKTRQEVITDLIINNPNHKNNLYNKDISFNALFSKLSIKSIIKVVQSIILEKQIILFTTQVWDLATITEAFLQFIYPLQWRCIYIPYLPAEILDTLHVSVPYIIGVHCNLKERVLTQYDCLDKILVDLDQDRVIGCNLILPFPEQLVETLINQSSKFSYSDDSELLQVQCCFLKFQLQMINNIVPYFIYSDTLQQKPKIEDIFDKDLYIEQFTPLDQEFYREFVNKTMMFQRFIEESYQYLHQKQFLKQNIKANIFIDLLLLINTSGYFNIYKLQNKDFEAKLFSLINESKQLIPESEKSIHSLFSQYQKQTNDYLIPQKKFPILKIDKSKIIQIDAIQNSIHQNSLMQRSTQSQKTDICNENKQVINILTIKVHKINPISKSYIQNDVTAQIILKYPKKSLSKLKKTLADQLLKLAPEVNVEQKPIQTSQMLSVRQSKRIFNTEEMGYVSMYRTKTYNMY
ncbi:unnamed protein product [Paramecium primaurelia]|uniref:UDENN domain-containing protein n=1 Tax=Paramecium primaurelia TaxID=5886 RepID=A0A8S1LG59_PARPR|nr:unnamed protein product [Paramecium primaurelia]